MTQRVNVFGPCYKPTILLFQLLELVEIEMRELLSDFGYDGNTVPMICGSALKALNGDESEFGT